MIRGHRLDIQRRSQNQKYGPDSYNSGFSRLDQEKLRLLSITPYGHVEPPFSIGAGFYATKTPYGCLAITESGSRMKVDTFEVRRQEDYSTLNRCTHLAKFVKPKYNFLIEGNERRMSLGHPSFYRENEELGYAQDLGEGVLALRGSDVGTSRLDIKLGFTDGSIEAVDWEDAPILAENYIMYCVSVVSNMKDLESRESSLSRRFYASGDTSWVAMLFKNAGFLAFDLASLVGTNSLLSADDADEMYEKGHEFHSGSKLPWMEVWHGPVMYVDDKAAYIRKFDVLRDGGIDTIVNSFIKNRIGYQGVEYFREREYRFCVRAPGKFKRPQYLFSVWDSTLDLFKWKGFL